MALTTTVSLSVVGLQTAAADLAQTVSTHSAAFGANWPSGTASGQADLIFSDTRTIAISGTDDLDLAGVLVGTIGTAITFARVKLIVVTADAGNTNNVVIGAAAATQFVGPFGAATHTLAVQPGNFAAFSAQGATAWPVTAATADLLRIANSGAGSTVTYSIAIVGASA